MAASEDPTEATRRREVALNLAVMHHGLSCLAEGAIPSRAETVLVTADYFLDYIDDIPTRQPARASGRR